MRLGVVAVLATAFATTASAQTESAPLSNPVMAHYRAYRAALERNDLAQAEVSAEAAFAASELRDGDGGRTAVLALNLAHVRLDRRRAREALGPALRAHALALSRGAQSGVDPLSARLTVGRAEIASWQGDEPRLVAALNEAASRIDIHTESYAAAIALSEWAVAHDKWEAALIAAIAAGRHAEGAGPGVQLARADARTNQGAALIMLRREREAYTVLTEALELCRPLAAVQSADGGMTVAQQHCAHTIAWRAVLSSRMLFEEGSETGTGSRLPRLSDHDVTFGRETRPGDSASCVPRVIAEPRPAYPREALRRLGMGAVVLRLKIDAQGEIVDRQIAAAVPSDGGFREAVERVLDGWRVVRHEDSALNCTMEMTAYPAIRFALR